MRFTDMRSFFLLLLFLTAQQADAIGKYKFAGLRGVIYLQNEEKVRLDIKSKRNLEISENCPKDIRDMLETLWLTRHGRSAVIHLIRTKSKIYLSVTDSVGALIFNGNTSFIYGITGPVFANHKDRIKHKNARKSPKLIMNYDGKLTWEAMHIELYKGSFNYGLGDTSIFFRNKIVIQDYDHGPVVSDSIRTGALAQLMRSHYYLDSLDRGFIRDAAALARRVKEMKNYYFHLREFYLLCAVHEISHTTGKNIELSRKRLDAEKDPYKAERKAKRKLKKVMRSERINY